MNVLFNLKKKAKDELATPQQSSSQEHLLLPPLRRSLSVPYNHDIFSDPPRSAHSERPSTSHSDSRSLSLHGLYTNYDQPKESSCEPVPLRAHPTGTTTPGPKKTLFISSRSLRKQVFFTTTPFPKTEINDIVAYIVTPGYYRCGINNWSAIAHGGLPNSKISTTKSGKMEQERDFVPLLAKVTRNLFWKKMVVDFLGIPEHPEIGSVRVEVNNVPGLVQRGYTFTLPVSTGNSRGQKEYRWCGTKMYSKTAGFADLKLVDPDTKQIIASFERKWSFSSFIPPETRADKPKLNHHGRDPIGCLHIFERNMPVEMNELMVIMTGYSVIEAEHRKRQKEGI